MNNVALRRPADWLPTGTLSEAVIISRVLKRATRAEQIEALIEESHTAALRPERVRELAFRLELHAREPHEACDACAALQRCVPRSGGAPRATWA